MKQAVIDSWWDFNAPLEGVVPHLYLDVLGLVTTGMGNLVDPMSAALGLPWRWPDGSLAERHAIEAQWQLLKTNPSLAKQHHRYAKELLEFRFRHALTLSAEDIEKLVNQKLRANEAELLQWFPDWHDWPADAQLAVASMAWAMGPAFAHKFPTFRGLMNGGDFAKAGTIEKASGRAPCDIRSTDNPGVVPRNRLNREHLVAAASELAKLAPDVLHGPRTLTALDAGWKQAPAVQWRDFDSPDQEPIT